jgi:structural maintenance of chromosome 4
MIFLMCSIRQTVADVEEAKSSFAAQSSSGKANSVVTAILKASKKGGALSHAGVRGRLGDLGTINQEYDVAVSTACGALECVVVDTTEGGQACVQFLKDNQLGRATFVILDKVTILLD